MANLTSIHLRGQLRTEPQDNFSYINADCPFYTIELWKQFEPELKWRVEKPKRVVVMDGQSTVMLIKTDDTGVKLPHPPPAPLTPIGCNGLPISATPSATNSTTPAPKAGNSVSSRTRRGWQVEIHRHRHGQVRRAGQ